MTIDFDFAKFEELCALQCTLQEIAENMDCSEDTVDRRVKKYYNCTFAEIFKRKRVKGFTSIRRSLFKLSEKHPATVQFLAQNWLGLTNKQELTGEITIKVVYDE